MPSVVEMYACFFFFHTTLGMSFSSKCHFLDFPRGFLNAELTGETKTGNLKSLLFFK